MEQMITANIALDICSIVLSLIPIVYLLSNRRYKLKLNQYFLGVSISNIFMIIGDLADWVIGDSPQPSLQMLLSIFSTVFYVASAFVLYFFARYMAEYIRFSNRAKKPYLTAVTVLCGIQIFFAVISPFTGSIFYVTENGYQRGGLFFISQLVPLFCYVIFTVIVIMYRKRLTSREVAFFLLYIFVPLSGGALQMFFRGIAVVNIGVALALLFILLNIQSERELLIKRQEKELSEMHVNIMLSQIQPHFLYNTLTTIRQLCDIDPKLAKESIRDFSHFLRANMDSLTNNSPIPFGREFCHTEHYLKLEQQRFVDRLSIVTQLDTVDFAVPPLTLQPLVENAVRHGIMMRDEGGTITIKTGVTENSYIVTVSDDGVGFCPDSLPVDERTHIGIQNVRERLRTMCNGDLKITSVPNKGTTATITIPKEEKP